MLLWMSMSTMTECCKGIQTSTWAAKKQARVGLHSFLFARTVQANTVPRMFYTPGGPKT